MNIDKKTKILVTGAAGFMGSHIVDELIKQGFENVYGIDDFSGGFKRNINYKCKFTYLDLRFKEDVENYIVKMQPEVIYHLSASAHEGASQFQPINILERNYMGYINLMVPAIKYGLKKVILFSSMAVYGNAVPPFDESLETTPVDIYGENKAMMEHSTNIFSKIYGISYVIIRPHNVIGERQCISDRLRNVAGIFMNRIMRDEPLFIYGDGDQLRAFSGVEYSLPCYISCLNLTKNEIVNIGGKYPVTVNRLADVVCDAMSVSNYKIIHLADRPLEVKNAFTTYSKSEKILNYVEPTDGWIKTIYNMATWAKNLGKQNWLKCDLELVNEKTPKTWLSDFDPSLYK